MLAVVLYRFAAAAVFVVVVVIAPYFNLRWQGETVRDWKELLSCFPPSDLAGFGFVNRISFLQGPHDGRKLVGG